MLHACVERFDVMGGRENILGWEGEVNKALARYYLCPQENATLAQCHVLVPYKFD
jgi:hypothetical protein